MKTILKIIIYACYAISAIAFIPFILITADYDPAWIQGLPYQKIGGAGLFFLPVTALWTVYYIIAFAAERRWKLFAYSLTGLVLTYIVMMTSIKMLSGISIRDTDQIALEILNGNDAGYKYQAPDGAMTDFRVFQKQFDVSAVRRMSAFTPYSRYDYIVMPKSSAPFTMAIFKYDKLILLSKAGIENALARKDSFIEIR